MFSSSPFTPGYPVPREFFAGRIQEIEELRRLARASATGRISVGFVTGERGIGKSSLAAVVRQIMEQDDEAVGCHVHLGGVNDLRGLMKATIEQVLKDSMDRPWHGKIREILGNRVQKVGLVTGALELTLSNEDLRSPRESFIPAVRRLLSQAKDKEASVLLILDDINGLAKDWEFANWLKSFVDEAATSRREINLCLILVGLDERRREMMVQQPSVGRIFTRVDIAPWTDQETTNFYRTVFRRAGATVSENGLQTLTAFTGGFPILAHEIGAAVWDVAEEMEIRDEEILAGIWRAAGIMSEKLLPPGGLELVRSRRGRSILAKMDSPRQVIRRADLIKGLAATKRSNVDGFLSRMKKVGILEPVPFERGEYRFPSLLHVLSIWLETKRPPRRGPGGRR